MNSSELTESEIKRLTDMVRIQARIIKQQAIINAVDDYQAFAEDNALSIASECAALIEWFGAPKSNSPFTAQYMKLRDEADRLRKETELQPS
jgi:hypothetical protein